MPIRTPEQPSGYDYEDFVVAWLQASGYFTETRLILKEETAELLELDAVASPARSGQAPILVDAKKGKPSLRDAFTAHGWRLFLGFDAAAIVHSEEMTETSQPGFRRIKEEANVSAVHVQPENPSVVSPFETVTGVSHEVFVAAIHAGWLKQIAVRMALGQLLRRARSLATDDLRSAAKSYREGVQASFFERKPIGRVNRLYDAYMSSPNLTGTLVDDLAQSRGHSRQEVWRKIRDTHELAWLQYVMLLEHHGRLAVIKSGWDHSCQLADEVAESSGREAQIEQLLASLAPLSFRAALRKLKLTDDPAKVPVFLQQFIELLGGWYRPDTEDEELVADLTGVGREEIRSYLELLNHFFPFENSWLYDAPSGITMVKLVPAFVRGCGCFLRNRFFSINDYESWCRGITQSCG